VRKEVTLEFGRY
jgi:hypothetical protein